MTVEERKPHGERFRHNRKTPRNCRSHAHGFELIASPISIGGENAADLIAHAAENIAFLVIGPGSRCWVLEWPVMTIHLTRKNRAGLIGVTAQGDDGLNLTIEKLPHVLRAMS